MRLDMLVAQARESTPGAIRLRSRSTSSSALLEPRRPPPLCSVASDPALPQSSVMLAQLLSAQHCECRRCYSVLYTASAGR